jgi:hypothetical protein
MYRWLGVKVIYKNEGDMSLAKYKNLEYISLLQSRATLAKPSKIGRM